MFALDAITAQNGWNMIFTGATIVIAGLSMLALIISQLHRMIAFWERKKSGAMILMTCLSMIFVVLARLQK